MAIMKGRTVPMKSIKGRASYSSSGIPCERLEDTGYMGPPPLRGVSFRTEPGFSPYSGSMEVTEIDGHMCHYPKRGTQPVCRGCGLVSGKHVMITDVRKIQV